MNPDVNGDQIGRHLEARARTIDLPRTDVGTIAERATRRRQRRQRTIYGVAGVTLLAGTSFAVLVAGGDDETPLATTPDAVVESPLDWTVVDPVAGLASSRGIVSTDDGAVYSLSTAPGPAAFGDPADFANRTLYRSVNGTEWETLDLPDDLYASSLGAEGSRLYAVGTGPTGGEGVPLRLSSSDDGGSTWSATVEMPGEVSALREAFGREISLGAPVVATHGGTTLVAVTVSARPDVEGRAPGSIDTSFGYSTRPEGVEVYGEAPPCAPEARECLSPPVIATLTWDQLDLPPELRALIVPRLYLFASTGDGSFEQLPPPIEEVNHAAQLSADADGFTLVAMEPFRTSDDVPATRFFTSPDGRAWSEAPSFPAATFEHIGVAGGSTMVSGWGADGWQVLGSIGGDGFKAIDPTVALEGAAPAMLSQSGLVGFGALGWAALLSEQTDSETPTYVLVHAAGPGAPMSAVVLPDDLADFGIPVGVTVTADAIVVRFTENGDGDPTTLEAQRLWVGTPAG